MRNHLNLPVLAGLTALLCGLIAGCAPSSDAIGEAPHESAEATADGNIATSLAASRQRVLASFPEAHLPDVEIVRYISQDEYGEVRAQCLTELGFPTITNDDGGFGGSFTRDQAQAHAVANYTCEARFPLDPKYNAPLTHDQLSQLYAYYVNELTDCLELRGEAVGEPPSESVFIQGYSGPDPWTPYLTLSREADFGALERDCPSVPAGFYD